LFLALGVTGFLVLVARNWLAPPPSGHTKHPEIQVRLHGELPANCPEDWVLTFHFPEIPLDLTRAIPNLHRTGPRFEETFAFRSQKMPTYAVVELQRQNGGKLLKNSATCPLGGLPLEGTFATLEPPRPATAVARPVQTRVSPTERKLEKPFLDMTKSATGAYPVPGSSVAPGQLP